MEQMHSLLKRQLKRHFGDSFAIPPEWRSFIDRVDDAYREFDADREMLEHSLDLSSQELLDANTEMRAVFQAIPDVVLRANREGTILDIKAGAPGDLMRKREDLIGKRLQDVPLEDVARQFSEAIAQVVAQDSPVSFEYAAVLHGQESHYEARLVPLPEMQLAVIVRNITERKQSLRLLASAVEQTTESIVIAEGHLVGPGAGYVFVNPAFTRMTGYSFAEAVGQTPLLLRGPKTARADLISMRETLGRGESYSGETIAYRKDGTEFLMERHVVPLRNSAGAVTHFLGMQRDITERRRAEEELRLKTAVLEAQLNSSLDAIIVVDPQGRKTLQNGRTAELFKIPASIVLGGSNAQQLEWVTGMTANPRQFADKLAHLYSHPNEISREEIALKDGTILDRYTSPVMGSAGECYGRIWTYRDITARHRVENALRESNEKFLLLAENITDVFWIRSPDMREVLYVSPGFERIWGRPAKHLHSHPAQWADAVVPEDRDRVLATFATLTGTAPSISIEYRIERPDGDRRWVHARGFQVRDANGKLCRLTGAITDITERKQSEAQLAAAHKELVDISRQAGMAEIATNVLHNVGNILNSVNVSAALINSRLRNSRADNLARAVEMLVEHSADLGDFLTEDPKGKLLPAYLGRLGQALAKERAAMMCELAHLTRSVEHIKDVVATQQSFAGAVGVIEPVEICDLAEAALHMYGDALASQGVTVVREFAAVPVVRLDRARVLQILVNLVSNAQQAMEGRPIVSQQMTLRVEVIAGSCLRVSVQDKGEGIAPENHTRIFAHGFTTRKAGHGFGLHSCALAARQMGGTLTADSDGPGRGATFTLELPIDAVQAAP